MEAAIIIIVLLALAIAIGILVLYITALKRAIKRKKEEIKESKNKR